MNNAVEQYPGQIKDLEDRVLLMEEIFKGERVVIPNSIEHARMMIAVGQQYIDTYEENNNVE